MQAEMQLNSLSGNECMPGLKAGAAGADVAHDRRQRTVVIFDMVKRRDG